MVITEENFIQQMKLGNESALAYFIDHYGWIVKSVVHKKMVLYPSEQEACMNQVFFAIWQNIASFDEERAGIGTWVNAVTRYQVLKYVGKMRWADTVNIEELDLPGEKDVRSDIFMQSEKEDFQLLLNGLSPEDQEIFVKLFWDEMSCREVGETLGMPVGRIYQKVSRGKKKLRKSLKSKQVQERYSKKGGSRR